MPSWKTWRPTGSSIRSNAKKETSCLSPTPEYAVLTETYQEWAENPDNEIMKDFDPNPLPVEYINEAEPTL
jgi:hypothetical protein